MQITDYRRNDKRNNVLANPFWLTSSPIYGTDIEAATKSATITGTGLAGVHGSPDTITDTGNGFVTAGFLAGDVIAVSGFTGAGAALTANNAFLTIDTGGVAAGTLNLVETQVLSDAAGEAVTIISPRANVVFSFPTASQLVLVHKVVVEVITGFTANTQIVVGAGTIATDAVTTDGLITNVDFDRYIDYNDVTAASAGSYSSASSTWAVAAVAGTYSAPRKIVGAATNTPVVYVSIANITNAAPAAIAAGCCRVHMLVAIMPV